jgi:hypothetical protein
MSVRASGSNAESHRITDLAQMSTYSLVHFTNEVFLQQLTGFIRMANIFKSFGGILGTFIEKDFFTTGVLTSKAAR